MGSIIIETAPDSTEPELAEYLSRMMILINIELNSNGKLINRTDLPDRPIIGSLYFFSQPIVGHPIITAEGYYGYLSSNNYVLIAS